MAAAADQSRRRRTREAEEFQGIPPQKRVVLREVYMTKSIEKFARQRRRARLHSVVMSILWYVDGCNRFFQKSDIWKFVISTRNLDSRWVKRRLPARKVKRYEEYIENLGTKWVRLTKPQKIPNPKYKVDGKGIEKPIQIEVQYEMIDIQLTHVFQSILLTKFVFIDEEDDRKTKEQTGQIFIEDMLETDPLDRDKVKEQILYFCSMMKEWFSSLIRGGDQSTRFPALYRGAANVETDIEVKINTNAAEAFGWWNPSASYQKVKKQEYTTSDKIVTKALIEAWTTRISQDVLLHIFAKANRIRKETKNLKRKVSSSIGSSTRKRSAQSAGSKKKKRAKRAKRFCPSYVLHYGEWVHLDHPSMECTCQESIVAQLSSLVIPV